MSKKTIMLYTLCIGIGLMAIAYAAFTTTFNVSGTTSQIGTFGVQLTECWCRVGTGLEGATAPTGSCTPSGTNKSASATITATLNQPGDFVTCYFDVVNTGNLKAKPNGNPTCTPSSGITSSASSSGATPMYYEKYWEKNALSGGATLADEIAIVIAYSSSITSQPSATSGSVTCTFPYTQDI